MLPELGEERIAEIGFDRIAGEFLGSVTGHQTFSEQVVSLLEGSSDDGAAERMRYKATSEFVAELDAWIESAATCPKTTTGDGASGDAATKPARDGSTTGHDSNAKRHNEVRLPYQLH